MNVQNHVTLTDTGTASIQKWLCFEFGKALGTATHREDLRFGASDQDELKNILLQICELSEKGIVTRKPNRSGRSKRKDAKAWRLLRTLGSNIYRVLARVESTPPTYANMFGDSRDLVLNLDSRTRSFPWEICYNGNEFLCNKYNVGRKMVNPPAKFLTGYPPETNRAIVLGLNYDWLENPDEHLEFAENEAKSVEKHLSEIGYDVCLILGEDATKGKIRKCLEKSVSIFHFTGHGKYRMHSGEGSRASLSLAEKEELTEKDLMCYFHKAKGAPFLSFINACESAKEIYSSPLMDAFVDFGCEYVIGTLWSVIDKPSVDFSREFYQSLKKGVSIGDSLSRSRQKLRESRTFENLITWPAFVLYGNPSYPLPEAP